MSDPKIKLRAAGTSDIELLVEFNQAHAAEVEDKGLDANVLRKGIAHLMDEPRDGFYLIAEAAGNENEGQIAAGTLMVTTEWSDWRNAHFWWIQSVYVHPQYRRRGVYSSLHTEVAARARAANACGLRLYVEKENSGAQATYRKHGMEETYYLMFEDDWS